jgi:hypothetical protein
MPVNPRLRCRANRAVHPGQGIRHRPLIPGAASFADLSQPPALGPYPFPGIPGRFISRVAASNGRNPAQPVKPACLFGQQ